MIVSAHQPAFNPWLGYLHKILTSERFVVMDDVQYEKNSFINRNRILQKCTAIMLTIPVELSGHTQKVVADMRCAGERWKEKHLRTIRQAYSKAPLFDTVFPRVESIYAIDSRYLKDYTDAFLDFLLDYLDVKTEVIYASSLGLKGRKLEYVLELCEKCDADIFIFGRHGKEYADIDYMRSRGVEPYFQDYRHPIYRQRCDTFQPYMGVLDLLFNEERDAVEDIIFDSNVKREELKSR